MANDVQTTGNATTAQPATNGATPAQQPKPSTALAPVNTAMGQAGEGAIDAFSNASNFATAQRMATALASSSMVPKEFQGNVPNCLIALELASRIGASIFAVMQNLDIIHGKPSFRATFLIATVNACGRFTPLRFRWIGERGTDDFGCYAVAKDRETGEECVGTEVTIGMAKAEGWYSRNGSKWKTLTTQMLCYRAAAFWQRLYAPELGLGMSTSDEVIDTYGYTVPEAPAAVRPGSTQALEAALRGASDAAPAAPASAPVVEATIEDKPAEPAKPATQAKGKDKGKPTKAGPPPAPEVEIDPETGEIVPPNAGDAWLPDAPERG